MDWNTILSDIIISVVGLVSTGLFALIAWLIRKYVKDKGTADALVEITALAKKAVLLVSQTYVDAIKKGGKWDEETKAKAKELALETLMSDLTPELLEYVKGKTEDVKEWLGDLIESQVKDTAK